MNNRKRVALVATAIASVLCPIRLVTNATAKEPSKFEMPALVQPGKNGYVESEFIYALDDKPTPQCHASTITETPSGLVAAWFGGQHERNPDVGIWLSRRSSSGWSKPVEIANGVQSENLRHPCWNPVLFQPSNGPLMLFYKVGPSPSRWWGMLTTSSDHGRTWTSPRKIGENKKIGHLLGPVKNKPVAIADGSILCPSSTEHDGWRVHFERTEDLGKTWEVVGPIHTGERFSAIQPSILIGRDGVLRVLCRSRQNVIVQATSKDGGATWSAMSATDLPNPNAGTDAVSLRDGRHLLVYNHTTRNSVFPSGRNMLNVAISPNGETWTPVLTLERAKGEYSYPAVIQSRDDLIHVVYTYQRQTIKHVVLNSSEISAP